MKNLFHGARTSSRKQHGDVKEASDAETNEVCLSVLKSMHYVLASDGWLKAGIHEITRPSGGAAGFNVQS